MYMKEKKFKGEVRGNIYEGRWVPISETIKSCPTPSLFCLRFLKTERKSQWS